MSPIFDVESLDRNLPDICAAIFSSLSSRELEATSQQCLAIDLKEAGVELQQEVEIPIIYRGQRVGARRADIVLKTPDDSLAVLKLKALKELRSEDLRQLQFYMYHLGIDTGYLINFPHDRGFPDIPDEGIVFQQTVLAGHSIVSDRTLRTPASKSFKS